MHIDLRRFTSAALLGGATLLAGALAIPSASAASAELSYDCAFGVDELEGTGNGSATFDSGIGEGLVVKVGDMVSLDPFTGSITLPDEFVDVLREVGVEELFGSQGLLLTLIDETGDEHVVELSFPTTVVPAEGPIVLQISGKPTAIKAAVVGTNTLIANDFILEVGTGASGPDAGMYCGLIDEGDLTIDAFEATAASTPTTTPTKATPTTTTGTATTGTPKRPKLVQTDFAGDDRSVALPILVGGGFAATTAVLVASGAGRARTRRH